MNLAAEYDRLISKTLFCGEMDKYDAQDIIDEYVDPYRKLSYKKLTDLIDRDPITDEVKTDDGLCYLIELQVFWDDQPEGDIRFVGSISESPKRPLFWKYPILKWIPIYYGDIANGDFVLSPQGEFIDE